MKDTASRRLAPYSCNRKQRHVVWSEPRGQERIGTGVIHGGHVFINTIHGVVECVELESGKAVWRKRLAGSSGKADTWSSLFLADRKIYALNQSADVFVFEASPQYKLIATNSLGEHTNSTVVGSQGNIFIRTHEALWCIGVITCLEACVEIFEAVLSIKCETRTLCVSSMP